MASPFSEPTSLVQIFGSYKSQVKSTLRTGELSRVSEKRALATRLEFDESFDGFQQPKIPKLSRDPFDSALGRKRFASENSGAVTILQKENEELKEKIKALTVESAGDLAKISRLENRFEQAELTHKKEKIDLENKLEKATRLYKLEVDKCSELGYKIKKLVDKKENKDERVAENRRQSLNRTDELENKVRSLRDNRSRLEGKLEQLQSQLSRRPDIDTFTYNNQIHKFEAEVSDLQQRLREAEDKNKILKSKIEGHEVQGSALMKTKEELLRYKNRVEKLESEMEANRDVVLQRRIMQEKLEKFAELERESISLRSRNQLLVHTQDNIRLLNEQILNLKEDKARAESWVKDRDNIKADLEIVRKELEGWRELMMDITSADDRGKLGEPGELGLHAARQIIQSLRRRELEMVTLLADTKSELNLEKEKNNSLLEKIKIVELDLSRTKTGQVDQARLIKKLQRNLLLVTKERDSNRAILDSVEKEMTLSGNQWEQEKIIGLEKTLEEYKAMVEMLMEKDGKDGADGMEKNRSELVLLRENYSQLKNKYMKLELELDRRSIRGDYNPSDTKVLHLRMNPLSSAVEKEGRMKEELQKDNDALRARIQLLEEGQTKDLTMMVGHRLEEGVSSQEVQNLQEQLKSSDLKNQRIMEMFKKTSKEFREFVFQTTGYRIDKSGEDTYKVKSVYVDSPDSYLLFKLSEQAGLEMLESEFSLELEELMELHLEQQNSFPMFLAGLTMQAYRKRQGTYCEEDEEEVDEHDEEVDEHDEDDDGGEVDEEDEEDDDDGDNEIDDARSVDSGDSSDVICVEDD